LSVTRCRNDSVTACMRRRPACVDDRIFSVFTAENRPFYCAYYAAFVELGPRSAFLFYCRRRPSPFEALSNLWKHWQFYCNYCCMIVPQQHSECSASYPVKSRHMV